MLISKHKGFIFIHIYKNAGTSITSALLPSTINSWEYKIGKVLKKVKINHWDPQPFTDHISASEIAEKIGEKKFRSFFSFAIVRNPWDWQVSLYKYMIKTKSHHQNRMMADFDSFESYIKWRCKKEVRLQQDFICSSNGDILVDFVGKFENINEDFEQICSHIKVKASLPKLNVSNTNPYQDYYTEESRELVRKAFKQDIDLFGYKF